MHHGLHIRVGGETAAQMPVAESLQTATDFCWRVLKKGSGARGKGRRFVQDQSIAFKESGVRLITALSYRFRSSGHLGHRWNP